MEDFDDYSADEIVNIVIDAYYEQSLSVKQISEKFGLSDVVINRIITQYKENKQQKKLEKPKNLKKDVTELQDEKRKNKNGITKEDIDDMKIDLSEFEKGKQNEEDLNNE